MKIDRHNFESCYIDYIEGNLSPSAQEEMRIFLLLNKDLEEKTAGLEEVRLKPSAISYPGKKALKKEETEECPDYAAIALAENRNVSTDDLKTCENTDFRELVLFYKKLRLIPDTTVVYKKKKTLYRPHPAIFRWYKATTAAIFLVLAGSVWFFLSPDTELKQDVFSQMNIPEPPPVFRESLPVHIAREQEASPIISPARTPAREIPSLPPVKKSLPVLTEVFEPLSLELGNKELNYDLILQQKTGKIVYHPEIYLTESALKWKASESRFLSDNIFNTMLHAGRFIAEKIRNPNQEK